VEEIGMARDALGLMGIDMEDDAEPFPPPTPLGDVERDSGDIVSLIDVDLSGYRRRIEQRSVRRNVTLPSWLDYAAEKAGVNVSAILQEALKEKLAV
jgi:hypothetical protein